MKKTLKTKINYRIKRSSSSVFVRADFDDLGGYDQVGRALKCLVKDEILIKLGYGIYARTRKSQLSGNSIPDKPLSDLAREALKKLQLKEIPSTAELMFTKNQSTQVPTGRVVGVKGRISRKIGYNKKVVYFEQHS